MNTLAADVRPAKIARDQTNDPAVTRRALLGTVTVAALVGVAMPASAAGPVTASPELLALIAAVRRAISDADAYERDVYDPANARRNAAVAAAKATLPHTTVDVGEDVVWTTANPGNVAAAQFIVSAAKRGIARPPERIAAARKLMAAHLRRRRTITLAERSGNIRALAEHSNALCDRIAVAEHAVAAFPARTPADLAAKLAFMVERNMGDGMDWLPELLADAQRIAGEIA